jgi:hypothetical protein
MLQKDWRYLYGVEYSIGFSTYFIYKKYVHRPTGLLTFDCRGMEISLATLEVDRFSEWN